MTRMSNVPAWNALAAQSDLRNDLNPLQSQALLSHVREVPSMSHNLDMRSHNIDVGGRIPSLVPPVPSRVSRLNIQNTYNDQDYRNGGQQRPYYM